MIGRGRGQCAGHEKLVSSPWCVPDAQVPTWPLTQMHSVPPAVGPWWPLFCDLNELMSWWSVLSQLVWSDLSGVLVPRVQSISGFCL